MNNNHHNPLVSIRCMTFNHKPYIRQCLNGFSMQKTDFPFIVVVVDDASTDNEPKIIRDYISSELNPTTMQKEETEDYVKVIATHKTNHNCTFIFLFLKYNHYSIKKNKLPYLKLLEEKTKYIAICEGDDYWTDPLKLQKQVNILEANPDFTMACNRTKLYSERRKKIIGENYCYNKSQIVNPKDVIYRTGLFISTCSVLYRKSIRDNIPDYWAKCKVGDYPLQIMCAMKGKIFYFNDIMSVYRVENSNSWMGQQKWGKIDEERIAVIKSRVEMFKGFAKDFPKYKSYFYNKVANEINRNVPNQESQHEQFLSYFSEEIKKYTWTQKIDLWVRRNLKGRVRYYFIRVFQNQYYQRVNIYKP